MVLPLRRLRHLGSGIVQSHHPRPNLANQGFGDGEDLAEQMVEALADVVIAALEPIQVRYREVTEDPGYIDGILRQSVEKLRPTIDETMERVRQAMGFK